MRDSRSIEDTAVRIAAMKAAKDAAEEFARQSAKSRRGSIGAFALYTWGSLAFISAIFALVLGVFPDSYQFIPTTIAENQEPRIFSRANPPMETNTPVDTATDTVVATPNPEVVPVLRTDPNRDLVILAEEQPIDVSSLKPVQEAPVTPRAAPALPQTPSLPQPPPQPVHLKPTLPVDDIQTGSVDPNEATTTGLNTILGVEIGSAGDASQLVNRYSALKRRAPDLFAALELRIRVAPAQVGQEIARSELIAGPFASKADVADFCRSIRLRLTIDCAEATFAGERIQ